MDNYAKDAVKIVIRKNKYFPNWLFVFLTITFIVSYNVDFRTAIIPILNTSVLQVCTCSLAAFLLAKVILSGTYRKKNAFLTWTVLMFCYFGLTSFWALNPSIVISTLFNILSMFFLLCGLSYYARTYEAIEKILLANYLSIIVCAVYLITVVDLLSLNGTRIGAQVEELEKWNANSIGMLMSCGAVTAFYYIRKARSAAGKVINLAFLAIFALICLLSGSRKALMILVMAIVGYMWFVSKGAKKIQVVFMTLVAMVVLYSCIMNVPVLYKVIGSRVENMLMGIFGEGTTERSFQERNLFISLGIGWFMSRPLFGYGLANYSVLLNRYMRVATYSHNNFIEMLVSGGIVGFCLYYSVYIKVLVGKWEYVKTAKDEQTILLFVINVVFLVMQWALVSYSNLMFTLFIMLLLSKSENFIVDCDRRSRR